MAAGRSWGWWGVFQVPVKGRLQLDETPAGFAPDKSGVKQKLMWVEKTKQCHRLLECR